MGSGLHGGFGKTQGAAEDEESLIAELEKNGVKFSKKDVIFITRDKTGKIIWLEKGNKSAGLEHILNGNGKSKGHASDFEKAFGIPKTKIPDFLKDVIQKGKIMNEFMHGPVWIYNSDGIALWKYPPIEDDPVISPLNTKAMEMFTGYYEFDSNDMPCRFNEEREKSEKHTMLDIITKIIARLNEINDGSFIIEDYETERLKSL